MRSMPPLRGTARFAGIPTLALLAIMLATTTASAAPSCTAALVGLWTGDETPRDAWGSNHGALTGSAAYGAGQIANGFLFSGGVWVGPNAVSQWPDDDLTVDAWVRLAPTGSVQTVFSMFECGDVCRAAVSNSALFLQVAADGTAVGFVRGGTPAGADGTSIGGSTVITDGEFHHIALVRDVAANEVRIYVDGVLEGTEILEGAAASPMGDDDGSYDPMLIGALRFPSSDTFWRHAHGTIDEVALYHRALAPIEIQALHDNGDRGRCPGGPGAPIPVPELGTLVLMAAGIAVLGGALLARRREL